MTPQIGKDGYLRINLVDDAGRKKSFLVHRVVASKFVDNPNDLPEVNHKDGDKTNNNVCNLEWCTRSENMRHRISALGYPAQAQGLINYNNLKKVKVKCRETGEIFGSIHDAARFVDKKNSNIYQSFRTGCACGGYHWERLEGEMLK